MSQLETSIRPDPERVRQIRQAAECGLMEARCAATREALIAAINGATSLDDLKPVLRTLAQGWG